jgi:hypothetical protein
MTGGFISVCQTKVLQGPRGLVGFSGDPISGYTGALYLCGDAQDRPITAGADCWYLALRPDGVYLIDSEFRELPLKGNKYYAIGSGEQAAMVAMHMGATAAEAVKMAIRVDEYSGGTVKEFTL